MNNNNSNNNYKKIGSGVIAGTFNTIIFNPYDRALYLYMRDGGSFFSKKHWTNPYQGVSQALFHRIISYGIYFTALDIFRTNLENRRYFENKNYAHLMSSLMTGLTIETITTPISAVKMKNWNTDTNKKFLHLTKQMYLEHGFSAFTRGLGISLARGSTFSIFFGYCTLTYNEEKSFVKDTIFASCATILSSPKNYIRNRIYQIDNEHKIKPKIIPIIKELINDVKTYYPKNNLHNSYNNIFIQRLWYLLHNKLCVNFGTIRVGLGMATSKFIYDKLMEI